MMTLMMIIDKDNISVIRLIKPISIIFRCYAMIGDYKKATHHCLQSSEAVEKAYGSSSVEYGHELHKLSQLLFNDQQVKKALAMVDKAINLLGIHYGRCHPDVQELSEMRKCLVSANGGS